MIIKTLPFIFFYVLGIASESYAQLSLQRSENIPFYDKNDNILSLAQAGGLNNPQFNAIDLDLDGFDDLLIYDGPSKSVITLKNKGIANTIAYEFKPNLQSQLPPINNWVVCIDFDGDGKKDLFTSFASGVSVYKNTSSASQLSFKLYSLDLQAFFDPFYTNIFVSAQDIPAIVDIDNDGDVDILTFELGVGNGDAMYLYKNLAKEKWNRSDTLDMALDYTCWGNFREDANNCTISLNACSGNKQFDDLKQKINHNLHAGSSTLVFDANGDGLPDLLIGDLGCNTMDLLINGGTLDQPNIIQEIKSFPSVKPINMSIFPAAFHIDVNNDGLKDLLISPHASSAAENKNNVLLYLKTGNNIDDWTYVSHHFLVDQMIDFGEGSFPRFVDFDGDGFTDIVAGNTGYFTPSLNLSSSLAYLKNFHNQYFKLMDSNALNLSSLNFVGLNPNFSDLDKDGKTDIIFGEREGNIHVLYNNTTSGNIKDITVLQTDINYKNIDVGQFSIPTLIDIDKDGNDDLVIGGKISRLSFYKGLGNNSFEHVTDSLGRLNLESSNTKNVAYLNHQILDYNKDGKLDMVATSLNGILHYFDNIEDKLALDFITTAQFDPKLGQHIGFDIGDWNKDGILDMVIGSYRGGISLYQANFSTSIAPTHIDHLFIFQHNQLSTKNTFISYPIEVNIYHINGQLAMKEWLYNANQWINCSELRAGLYMVKAGSYVQKIVKL